jgi:lipopolysaccharide transport system permease protein
MTNQNNSTAKYHTHISSKHKLFSLNLKEVWRYKDLIILFTKRSFVLTYKQTILGPLWIFLSPLVTTLIHTFVFGGIAGIETDGVPQFLFYFCGNALWTFFASCVTKNASTFTANAGVFGKVYFPRLTTPISNILSSLIQFGIQAVMLFVFLIYFLIKGAVSPNWIYWLLIPVELIHLGLLGLGFGIIISSMTTEYRDLSILVGFGVSLWMYITPVVYPMSQLGDGIMKTALMINPATAPFEVIRYAILGEGTIMIPYLALSWAVTIIVMVCGIMVFNKVEKTFMDTV